MSFHNNKTLIPLLRKLSLAPFSGLHRSTFT